MALQWGCNVGWVWAVSLGMGEAIRSFNDRSIAQCAGENAWSFLV